MRFWRLLKYGLFATLLLVAVIVAWLQYTKPILERLPALQNGDLVFQTINSHQTAAVMFATHSLYTHVGIVRLDLAGKPLVMEAVGPVREIPLARWIKQGLAQRLAIMRLPGLTSAQAHQIVAAAQPFYGKPYDLFFLMDEDRIYCSELVYKSYANGAAIPLGAGQKVSELNLDNFAVTQLLKERWRRDPLCQTPATSTYESCRALMWQQDIITPVSIARDPRLTMLYTNYPF